MGNSPKKLKNNDISEQLDSNENYSHIPRHFILSFGDNSVINNCIEKPKSKAAFKRNIFKNSNSKSLPIGEELLK